MPAGEFRELLSFQKRGSANDGAGNVEGDFVEQFRMRGQLIPRLGGEEVLASRLQGNQPFTIRVHSCADTKLVKNDWRIQNKRTDALYNIRAISNPDQHSRWLDILVVEGPISG